MLHSPQIMSGLDRSIQKYCRQPVPDGSAVIYALVRMAVLKAYIGQATVSARKRMMCHRRNPDGCEAIYSALRKHGSKAFRFIILAICPEEEADALEIALIAKHGTQGKDRGYNILEGGKNAKQPPEVTARIQAKRKVTMATPASKTKRAKAAHDSWNSESTRKLREERSAAKMEKMVADAWAVAVPDVDPKERKHGAFYVRGDKVFRYYLPPGRAPGRGNFTEISKEAIEAKRKETQTRMEKKRGVFEG